MLLNAHVKNEYTPEMQSNLQNVMSEPLQMKKMGCLRFDQEALTKGIGGAMSNNLSRC